MTDNLTDAQRGIGDRGTSVRGIEEQAPARRPVRRDANDLPAPSEPGRQPVPPWSGRKRLPPAVAGSLKPGERVLTHSFFSPMAEGGTVRGWNVYSTYDAQGDLVDQYLEVTEDEVKSAGRGTSDRGTSNRAAPAEAEPALVPIPPREPALVPIPRSAKSTPPVRRRAKSAADRQYWSLINLERNKRNVERAAGQERQIIEELEDELLLWPIEYLLTEGATKVTERLLEQIARRSAQEFLEEVLKYAKKGVAVGEFVEFGVLLTRYVTVRTNLLKKEAALKALEIEVERARREWKRLFDEEHGPGAAEAAERQTEELRQLLRRRIAIPHPGRASSE